MRKRIPLNGFLLCIVVVGVAAVTGCDAGGRSMDLSTMPPEKAEMAGYYLPSRIEILPFTKVGTFDAQAMPDGISAVVRPTDVLGDATKAYGTIRFELYEFVPASGEPRGEQITVWNQKLSTPADQRKYWDRVTQTYQFRLAWRQPLTPDRKYVLLAVYETPAGARLTDEYVFDFAPNLQQLREEFRQIGQGQ